jgi:hypothetical protein
MIRVLAVSVVVSSALCACGAATQSTTTTDGPFIALQRDFAGFEDWEPFSFEQTADGPAHLAGPRTVYLNHRPPRGSTTFPIGTILVKSIKPPGADEQILAMVKRGAGFNQNGATGWEWFELQRSAQGAPVIVWRGVGPPAGENYSQTGTSCNDCHSAGSDNDFVRSEPLSLKNF